ncbi:MAG: DUF169 domain-containing protein [Bacteroidetes bacterium]|nr:DUF169 domain-containing protein [Bacteroidota bacterium]
MDITFRNTFLEKWAKYFADSDLPIAFYYAEDPGDVSRANLPTEHSCIVCELALVRKGRPLAWNVQSLGCGGARRYLGYTEKMRPNFEYFLSHGIPGEMEGERYIQTPEMVKELMSGLSCIPAKGKYIVFKRFDQLTPDDNPDAVIFFAKPDVLSGLFTLANFDQPDGNGVISPFGSGCGAIVYQPLLQNDQENPKAILGMFDVSARPCVPKDALSFSIPMKKFVTMVGNMDESFLVTETWNTVKKRL